MIARINNLFSNIKSLNNQMHLHPLTLKFTGESAHLEEPFLKDYYQSSLFHIRMFLIVGAVLYAAFGVLDALLMPKQMMTIWMIRLIVIGPALVLVLLVSFTNIFEKYIQPVMAFAYILAGGGIVVMIVIAPPLVSYSYYAGLMLTFAWGYTLIRLFFTWATFAGWFQVILYEIAAVMINPAPFHIFIGNNFFFISANIVGMMACYTIEFYARRDFFMKRQLEIEQENVNKINSELEERVKERTEDYRKVNVALPSIECALGAASALVGPKAAMAVTAAVETEIDRHYQAQREALAGDDPELEGMIADFQAEEVEHRDSAIAHGAEEAPAYPLMSALVRAGCRAAIRVAEKI